MAVPGSRPAPFADVVVTPSPTALVSPQPTASPAATSTPAPANTPTPANTSASQNLNFGIAAGGGLADIGTADLDTRFQDMRAIGVKWVRFDVDWSKIQPDSATSYDWTDYDRIVQALQANGLHGLGIIDFTPTWAQSTACAGSNRCEPADPAQYAAFAKTVAARYSPDGMHTWEIWNEPNITDFWLPQADTSEYTQMLKLSYQGIKNADPASTVLVGGLASCGTGAGNLSPTDFLSGIYASGGKGSFDAVADHPYAIPFLPSFGWYWNYWQQMAITSPSLRSVMVANGDGAKKIWITEYGTPTGGPGGEASNGMTMAEQYDDHVTESLQAETVTQAVQLYKSYPWAGAFFWYSYEDNGTDESDAENFYGLLRADGSRKPAYYAFQTAISNAQ